MEADQLGRLRDILESARLIAAYVDGVTEAAFRSDSEKQDAVVRRIDSGMACFPGFQQDVASEDGQREAT